MKVRSFILLVFLVCLLAGCGRVTPSPVMDETTTPPSLPTAIKTLRPTNTPQIPTLTPLITYTPTTSLTPTITPTAGPLALSVANIHQIQQLGMWGKGVPNSIAWTPDGKYLVVGSTIGIYIYDAGTMQQVRYINVGEVGSIAISPDGKTVATASNRVNLWDFATGTHVKTLPGNVKEWFSQVTYSPDGAWLAATGWEARGGDPPGALLVWSTRDQQLLYKRETIACGGGTVIFSPDGKTFAHQLCGYLDFFDTSTDNYIKGMEGDSYSYDLLFLPEGENIIAGTGSNTIDVIRIADEKTIRTYNADGSGKLTLSPDGKTLVVSDIWDQSTQSYRSDFLDLESGNLLFSMDGFGECERPVYRPDGKILATISCKGDIQLWDIDSREMVISLPSDGVVRNFSFGFIAQAGSKVMRQVIVTGNSSGNIRIIDVSSLKILQVLKVSDHPISAVALHPGGKTLAFSEEIYGDLDTLDVILWDLTSDKKIKTLQTKQGDYDRIYGLAFSADGNAVAAQTSSWYGWSEPVAWDINYGEQLPEPAIKNWQAGESIGADFSGHLIGLDQEENVLKVIDRQSGDVFSASVEKIEYLYMWGSGNDQFFTMSSDRRYIAIGSGGSVGTVWDLVQKKWVHELAGHQTSGNDGPQVNITAIQFDPYEYLLVTGGNDSVLHFWNAQTGERLYTIREHHDRITDISFSPDGRYFASASCDGTLRLWGLVP